jgi:CheY-like chemotaxis protein
LNVGCRLLLKKEIEASNVKSEFLATISHEIRSPLNVITSLSHILLADDHLPGQKENLEILKIASNSLMMLINDVLDFSKIESGKLELKKYSFDLHSMLKDLQKSSKPLAEEKNIYFKLEYDKNLPRVVYSDSLRIRQILVNLISNALKFTEEGGVSLNVRLLNEMTDSYLIRFEVCDTGIGIPKHKLKEIFEEFYQVSKKHSRNGTGLGLSISKHLLNLLNTEMRVESIEGEGSKFSFNIDLAKGDPKELSIDSSETSVNINDISILIVDDMAFNRIVIKKMLKKWNLNLDFAENGQEAVQKVQTNHYDLILMDVHMPIMNGIQATKAIRCFDQNTCIVALTASSDEKTKDQVINAGMNSIITKPIIPNELHKIIKSHSTKCNLQT